MPVVARAPTVKQLVQPVGGVRPALGPTTRPAAVLSPNMVAARGAGQQLSVKPVTSNKILVRPPIPTNKPLTRPPIPTNKPLVRPPVPTNKPLTRPPVPTMGQSGQPITTAPKPPTIARPPTPRQTPTGGTGQATAPRPAAPKPIMQAAIRQQTGGTVGATSPRPPAAGSTASRPYIPQPDTNPVGRSTAGGQTEQTTGKAPPAPAPGTTNVGPGGKTPGPPQGAPDTGTPNTTPPVPNPPVTPGANPNPIPLDPTDQAAIAAANSNWGTAQAVQNLNMQNAAMAYGDPNLMSQWGLPATVNPNSTLALAATKAQLDTQRAEDARARAGTFFSSLMGNDLSNVGAAQQRADLAGYQKYQDAMAKFNLAVGPGGTDWNTWQNTINSANADQVTKALGNLPTPDTAGGSFVPGNIVTPTSKTAAVKTPKGAKGAKAPAPKKPAAQKKLPTPAKQKA